MPLDNAEKFSAAMKELVIGQNTFEAISLLPPAPRKATDFEPIFGTDPNGFLHRVLAEVDDPVHNAADLIPILGLDPKGNLGQQLQLVDQVLADIKD